MYCTQYTERNVCSILLGTPISACLELPIVLSYCKVMGSYGEFLTGVLKGIVYLNFSGNAL